LIASLLLRQGSLCENAIAILGATGLGGMVMNKLHPLLPVNLPEIDFGDEK
jgi:hypothetical protein